MQLIYRAERAGKQAAIARGSVPVEVYPDDLLAGLARDGREAVAGLGPAGKGGAGRPAVGTAEAVGRQAHGDYRRRPVAVCASRHCPCGGRSLGHGDARAGGAAESGPEWRRRVDPSPDAARFACGIPAVAADGGGEVGLAGGSPPGAPSVAVDGAGHGERGMGGAIAGRRAGPGDRLVAANCPATSPPPSMPWS